MSKKKNIKMNLTPEDKFMRQMKEALDTWQIAKNEKGQSNIVKETSEEIEQLLAFFASQETLYPELYERAKREVQNVGYKSSAISVHPKAKQSGDKACLE